jgi:hypothetical protein
LAYIAHRAGPQPGGNAIGIEHDWLGRASDHRGIHQRGGVRRRGELAAMLAAALADALLFVFTFMGVSTIALGAGRLLQFPGPVAKLTAGYSTGQIVGPVAVAPLLRDGFSTALISAALVVTCSAAVAALLRTPRHDGAGRRQAATPSHRPRPIRTIRA